MVQIAPSILSADFARLGEELADIERGGADLVHVDVMDGRFVPNITIGPLVVKAAKASTALPLDVHLMIVEPERYLDAFVAAGADMLTVHQEACPHLHRVLAQIRQAGAKAGVALNPSTPPATLGFVAGMLDLVLVMSVNPGFGGQSFIASQVDKVRQVRALLDQAGNHDAQISVDGGVSPDNARSLVDAGADILVAGSAVFAQPDRGQAIAALRDAGARKS